MAAADTLQSSSGYDTDVVHLLNHKLETKTLSIRDYQTIISALDSKYDVFVTRIPGNVTIIGIGIGPPRNYESMHQVLNTTELLERILQKLFPTMLLRVEMVCKGFRNAIASSPSIRRKMFREADLTSKTKPMAFPYIFCGGRFWIHKGKHHIIMSGQILFTARYSDTFRSLPTVQPPRQELSVQVYSYPDLVPRGNVARVRATNNGAVTMGDIIDCLKALDGSPSRNGTWKVELTLE